MSKVINCQCKHKAQDELHGQGRRVCNKTVKPEEYRCTVCGAVHKQKG